MRSVGRHEQSAWPLSERYEHIVWIFVVRYKAIDM
jgi:hypothetical protein